MKVMALCSSCRHCQQYVMDHECGLQATASRHHEALLHWTGSLWVLHNQVRLESSYTNTKEENRAYREGSEISE